MDDLTAKRAVALVLALYEDLQAFESDARALGLSRRKGDDDAAYWFRFVDAAKDAATNLSACVYTDEVQMALISYVEAQWPGSTTGSARHVG